MCQGTANRPVGLEGEQKLNGCTSEYIFIMHDVKSSTELMYSIGRELYKSLEFYLSGSVCEDMKRASLEEQSCKLLLVSMQENIHSVSSREHGEGPVIPLLHPWGAWPVCPQPEGLIIE